jgi:hypothetical protein
LLGYAWHIALMRLSKGIGSTAWLFQHFLEEFEFGSFRIGTCIGNDVQTRVSNSTDFFCFCCYSNPRADLLSGLFICYL